MTQNGINNLMEVLQSSDVSVSTEWLINMTMDIWDDQNGEIRRKKKLEDRRLKIEKIIKKKCNYQQDLLD